MKSFLSKVVTRVLEEQKDLKNVVLVVPSERACVFLRDELNQRSLKASFFPEVVSIQKYIQDLSGIIPADYIKLVFDFYKIYQQNIPQKQQESFETFSQWATIALNDFNEIDSHLVPAESIFGNLFDVKRLQQWFKDKPPSNLAKNHLAFFKHLYLLYQKFTEYLEQQGVSYQGFIYKKAIENLPDFIKTTETHTVFIGFNALNKAEEVLFQELLLHKKANVFWDANKKWLETQNEAGYFLRNYKKNWNYYQKNPFLYIENELSEPKIHIVGTAKNIGQAKFVGELLSEREHSQKTAWVLADENVLPIALQSIPENVEQLNITMGYPLREVPLSHLFYAIFKLHLSNATNFYYKNVIEILRHPYLSKIAPNSPKIANKIIKDNELFISQQYLENNNFPFSSLFLPCKNGTKLIERCLEIIQKLLEKTESVEREFVYRFEQIFNQLQFLNEEYGYLNEVKTLFVFYQQILHNEKISFKGEPLSGLQLMGMLETRAIDFSTVIITSVNEGVLPKGKTDNSFIPFDIKKHFDMPTYQEKDAIFSYHFQRLLQRAKEVYLVYNTETDSYGSGEKSRFLTRILFENKNIVPYTVGIKNKMNERKPLCVEKTPELQERLRTIFEKEGISASALASYIYNPMTFYEQRVMRIKEQTEIEEIIASNTMGSVIHGVLEDLYKPFEGRFLQESHLKEMEKQIAPLLEKYVEKYFPNRSVLLGKNKLIFEVTQHYIERFLKQEKQVLQKSKLKIIATEKKIETILKIEGVDFPIKIQGIIDRVDQLNDTLRIIDYKTGKVLQSDLNISDFETVISQEKIKAMQILLYAYLYSEENSINEMETGIFSFKNLSAGLLRIGTGRGRAKQYGVTSENIAEFMESIKGIITEILNPDIPFVENLDDPFSK
ncbi:MAG: PD-(D/E)XK nuclease family protein [Flavobacteriaceae bacterium]|nr:PD-(D/E)XK nuclease family protein [Flavobacteriaceae bacterium]